MKMKKTLATLSLLLACAAMSSCEKSYDEFFFKGLRIDASFCNATSPSYMLQIVAPQGIGDTITFNGKLYHNCVMAYRSPELILHDDTIYGVGYLTQDYAVLNCNIISYPHLPEMGLLSVREDPDRVNEALGQ